jgi:hypothetical protein
MLADLVDINHQSERWSSDIGTSVLLMREADQDLAAGRLA